MNVSDVLAKIEAARPLDEVEADIARIRAELSELTGRRASLIVTMAEKLRSHGGDDSKLTTEHATLNAKAAGRAQLLEWLEAERYDAIKAAVVAHHRAMIAEQARVAREEQIARQEFGALQRQLAAVGQRVALAQNRRWQLSQQLQRHGLAAAVKLGVDGRTLARLHQELKDLLPAVQEAARREADLQEK